MFISIPETIPLYLKLAAQCSVRIHTDTFPHRSDFCVRAPSIPCPMLNKQELSSAARKSKTELNLQLEWEDGETMLHNCSSCVSCLSTSTHAACSGPKLVKRQHAWLLCGWINVCTFGEIICFLWRMWVNLCV